MDIQVLVETVAYQATREFPGLAVYLVTLGLWGSPDIRVTQELQVTREFQARRVIRDGRVIAASRDTLEDQVLAVIRACLDSPELQDIAESVASQVTRGFLELADTRGQRD